MKKMIKKGKNKKENNTKKKKHKITNGQSAVLFF